METIIFPAGQLTTAGGPIVPSPEGPLKAHTSSQEPVLLQVPSPLQLSLVQRLPSSQPYVVPVQPPAAQWSLYVHRLPSSQGEALLGKLHVPSPLHRSSVHRLPSLQA